MTRAYARAARGQRATGEVPRGRRERLTVIGALGPGGLVASRSVAAATGTAVFLTFVEQALVPALRDRPEAVVVMDNLAAHKAEAVRAALEAAEVSYREPWPRAGAAGPGAALLLARPEPDRAGLGQAQTHLRAVGARSKEALGAALGPALATITARDARGWFRLAGYPAAD